MPKITVSGVIASGAYRPLDQGASSLSSWKRALGENPANCYLLFLGDSTSFGAATFDYTRLRSVHTLPGMGLAGMTGDATHMPDGGNNGLSLSGWWTGAGGTFLYSDVQALYATAEAAGGHLLIVLSFGLNDLRTHVDQLGLAGSAYLTFKALLGTVITQMRTDMPNASFVLRIPNSATTDNASALNYVTANDGTVNPAGGAQALTDALRTAYLAYQEKWPNVAVWDSQDRLFGRKSVATTDSTLFANQIHPSTNGYRAIIDTLVSEVIGIPVPAAGKIPNQAVTGAAPLGLIGASRTPYTVDPRAVEDPDHYVKIAGPLQGNGTALVAGSGKTIIYGPVVRHVAPYDLLQIVAANGAREVVQVPTNASISASSSGGPVPNITMTNLTIPASLDGQTVWWLSIYRELDQGQGLLRALRDPLQQAYGFVRFFRANGGSGFLDLTADPTTAATLNSAEAPINPATDTLLFADGTSVTLATGNSGGIVSLRYQAPNFRLAIAGTDWSTKLGQLCVVYGNHPDRTWKGRVFLAVDPPSIAAGAVGTVDVAVAGLNVRNSNDGGSVSAAGALDQYPVRAIPPNTLEAGLVYLGCYPIATDSVRIVLANNTGSAIDGASKFWAFLGG